MKNIPLLARRFSVAVTTMCISGVVLATCIANIYFAFTHTPTFQKMLFNATAIQAKAGMIIAAAFIVIGYGIVIRDFCRNNW